MRKGYEKEFFEMEDFIICCRKNEQQKACPWNIDFPFWPII